MNYWHRLRLLSWIALGVLVALGACVSLLDCQADAPTEPPRGSRDFRL